MRDELICTLPSESTLVCPSHYPHLEIIHTNKLQAAHLNIPLFLLSLEPNIKIPSITMATATQPLLSVTAGPQHVNCPRPPRNQVQSDPEMVYALW